MSIDDQGCISPYVIIKNDAGELRAVKAINPDQYEDIHYDLDATSDFHEGILNIVLMLLEDKELKIGLLTKIYVNEEYRGQNHGSYFANQFIEQVVPYTDVDLLLARVDNPQRPGFSLQSFYEKLGFEGVMKSSGELLMVNKGYSQMLKSNIHNYMKLNKFIIEDETEPDNGVVF